MKHILAAIFAAVFVSVPISTEAATLTLGGSSQATVGQTLSIPVLLSTAPGENANAASATITYPSNILTLASVSKAGSIINLWAQDPSMGTRSASFEGVILNPGWSGSGGVVVTLVFQVKAAGSGSITFSDASVLANDGNATPILSSAPAKNITVTGAATPTPTPTPAQTPAVPAVRITSSSHPDQTQWYKETHVVFDWTNAQGVSSVRIGYDKNKDGVGTVVYSPAISHKEIDLTEGEWYFHVQQRHSGTWSPVATYSIRIGEVPAAPTTTEPVVLAAEPVPVGPSLLERLKAYKTPLLSALALLVAFLLGWLVGGRAGGAGKRRGRLFGHSSIHEQFLELRDAVSKEMLALQKAKTKRELTDEEERFLERFKKLLDRTERSIEKELSK